MGAVDELMDANYRKALIEDEKAKRLAQDRLPSPLLSALSDEAKRLALACEALLRLHEAWPTRHMPPLAALRAATLAIRQLDACVEALTKSSESPAASGTLSDSAAQRG